MPPPPVSLTESNPPEHFAPLKLKRALYLNLSVYCSDLKKKNANCMKGLREKKKTNIEPRNEKHA